MSSDEAVSPPLLSRMSPGRLSWRSILLIALFGLAVLIPGILGSTRTISSHEELAAQPAREMLSDGHWIIPTIIGVKRLEKPPTNGWLIAASMAIFRTDAEWAVRVPSLLSAILCSLIVAYLAARWLGDFAGLLAGLMQLVTVWVQTQANLAEADMPLTAAVALAFALFAVANVDHPSGRLESAWIRRGFMAVTGVAFLFKGPVALLFIFGGCAAYLLLTRQWRRFRFLIDPVGIVILLILALSWPIAALVAYPPIASAWYQETFGYARSSTFGTQPWWIYLTSVPISLLPWFLLAVPAFVGGSALLRRWLNTRDDADGKAAFALLLLAWFAPGMFLLQLTAYKSSHYTYPLLAPWSIIMAAGLIEWLRWQYCRPLIRLRVVGWAIAIAAMAGVLWFGFTRPNLPASIPAIIVTIAIGLLILIWLEHRRRLAAEMAVLFLTVAAAVVLADVTVIPNMPGARARLEFAESVNRRVPAGETIHYIGFATDEIQWYVRKPAQRNDSTKEFAESNPLQAPIYALTRKREIDDLRQYFTVDVVDTISVPSRADLRDNEAKRPYLVRLSAGTPGNTGPTSLPATPAATGPAEANPVRPASTQPAP